MALLFRIVALCWLFNSLVGYAGNNKQVILFVWDGLRPDAITQAATPNLYQLAQEGSYFSDHHASYPTFTMINAASFATGDFESWYAWLF